MKKFLFLFIVVGIILTGCFFNTPQENNTSQDQGDDKTQTESGDELNTQASESSSNQNANPENNDAKDQDQTNSESSPESDTQINKTPESNTKSCALAGAQTSKDGFISVSLPLPNEKITNPVVIRGSANTFEANVQIIIKDSNGVSLGSDFTIAEREDIGLCGPFVATIAFDQSGTSSGVIEIFDQSPKDGSKVGLVSIPVNF